MNTDIQLYEDFPEITVVKSSFTPLFLNSYPLKPRRKWEILGKSNQGNQGYSGNQKNITQVQRPDIENRHTRQRT